jgi:outer membrane murein-binding lipoprotein Lpp
MSGASRRLMVLVVTAASVAVLAAGCSAIAKVRQDIHNVESNKATVDAFTQNLQSTKNTPFEATYTTTGSVPATVVYAVDPPTGLAFHETASGSNGSNVQVIVNSTGEYTCNQSGSGGAWSCQKLGAADAVNQNKIFDIYTPAHWVAFLKGVSLVAGLAGDKVTSSTMNVNGFSMQCVDLVAHGVPGTSTICTTPQNILGYVKVASDPTSFQITNYTGSPAPSLFQLPPGATVSTVTTPTT